MLKSNRGISLVEVIVGAAIATSVISGVTAAIMYIVSVQKTVEVKLVLQQIRDNIYWNLVDETAWVNTVRDPTNDTLVCLEEPPFNCASFTNPTGYKINKVIGAVLTAPDPIIFDDSDAAAGFERGFNWGANKCVGALAADDGCPFRVNISWYATTSNNRPLIIINARFELKTVMPMPSINASRYNFTIQKPGAINAIENGTTCPSANQLIAGTDPYGNLECMDAPTPTVSLVACSQGWALQGIVNGAAVCKQPIDTANCGPGEYIDNISSDGSVACKKLPQTGAVGPDDTVITSFDSFGSPIYGKGLDGMNCPAGQVARGFTSGGGLACIEATLGGTTCSDNFKTCSGSCVAANPTDCTPSSCTSGLDAGVTCSTVSCTYTTTCVSGKGGLSYSCNMPGFRRDCTRTCRVCI